MPRSVSPPDWVLDRRRVVGDQIREARLHRDLSQEQVANLIGMDRPSYNRIEQGHASPLLDSLILIARALATPLADLVRDHEPTEG